MPCCKGLYQHVSIKIFKTMKLIQTIKLVILVSFAQFMTACSKEERNSPEPNSPEDLILVQTFSNELHDIALYTQTGTLQTGYNLIYLQIKDKKNHILDNVYANWQPMMAMSSMSHSCPYSTLEDAGTNRSLLRGFIIFQMPSNEMEYWELKIDYRIGDDIYSIKEKVKVVSAPNRVLESFLGTDSNRYIAALVAPSKPIVGNNEIEVKLYQMVSMMQFAPVNNYRIKIDPRMPSMGNHGSPNNSDLLSDSEGHYRGNLSLTMTGYWKINLQLLDPNSEIIKGEPINETQESSSIFFDLAF
jgi:hypothetical protein